MKKKIEVYPSDLDPADLPDWRGFDEQVIPDALGHYRVNFYGQSWGVFWREPRAMTGLVNTWIWKGFGFERAAWIGASIALHAFNAVVIYTLCRSINSVYLSDTASLMIAAVFALHPLQVPAILQTAARSGVQSATFAYSAMLALAWGFWPLAIPLQFLAQKSKEDAWLYLIFWPMVFYFSKSI